MKGKDLKNGSPRFLYRPTRVGLKLLVFRHVVVGRTDSEIIIKRGYFEFRHEFPDDAEEVISRPELETRGHLRLTREPWFEDDNLCPLGCLYPTKREARNALESWTMITLRENSNPN